MITPQTENKEFSEILEVLLEDGLDGMPRVFGMLMNEKAMLTALTEV